MGIVLSGHCRACGFETGWLKLGGSHRSQPSRPEENRSGLISCPNCQQVFTTSPLSKEGPSQCPQCKQHAHLLELAGFHEPRRLQRILGLVRRTLTSKQHPCCWCGQQQLRFKIVGRW